MSKIAIKNIGPIKNGPEEIEYINFDGLTILTGTQGSGKSTVAKIYSSLCWLEKALNRGDLTKEEVKKDGYFINEVMAYQGIEKYFSSNSFIHFIGEKCEFKLEKNIFHVKIKQNDKYSTPKIMYVPAERNFITSIDRPDLISGLPRPLHTFLAEYEAAKDEIQSNPIELPIGNIKFEHSQDKNESNLIGNEFKINIINASSGYQSFVPLFLVTNFLSGFIDHKDKKPKGQNKTRKMSVNLQRRMQEEIKSLITKGKGDFNNLASELFRITRRYSYSSFINIVEEPEQNLYPDSQWIALNILIKALNSKAENRLVITTHSPYILSFIALNFQAYNIYKARTEENIINEVRKTVPEHSALNNKITNVYELDNGEIRHLKLEDGFIPDSNKLNEKIAEINEKFSKLLYME